MSYTFEQGKAEIIELISQKARDQLDKSQNEHCQYFIEQLLSTVALDDLNTLRPEDLYGAMINLWELLYTRSPNEQKIHIYNPEYERHGWQSTHTVIQIIHDDIPFLVDSIQMEINRMNLTSHLTIHLGQFAVKRDGANRVVAIHTSENGKLPDGYRLDASVLIEVDRQTNPTVLLEIKNNLERVLADNRAVVKDWQPMVKRLRKIVLDLDKCKDFIDKNELAESKRFLEWLEEHFTFLGIRDYTIEMEKDEVVLKSLSNTGMGVLSDEQTPISCRSISAMTPEARNLTLSQQVLVISKTNNRSTVHRPAFTDYIGIKRFDDSGKVIGEVRIIGLYTALAYNTNPKYIPFLRHKVAQVMAMSKFAPNGHAGKILQNIIDTLPRDDLLQASPEELLEICIGIYHLQERRKIRMFARRDVYGRFISCLVFVPRDLFNTVLRKRMQGILVDSFKAIESSFSTRFSDSVLARIHFMLQINPLEKVDYDYKKIEQKLIAVGRNWLDDFKDGLFETYGEEVANQLINLYSEAFPVSYQETYTARTALSDIKYLQGISLDNPIAMSLYRAVGETPSHLRLKVYNCNQTIALSDVVPILENLGMRVMNERPYLIDVKSKPKVWIYEIGLVYQGTESLDVDYVKDRFQEAFHAIWLNKSENDSFNKLVLSAGLSWREVILLRAYAKYFKQVHFTFSQEYIERALNANPKITSLLVDLFHTRLSTKSIKHRSDILEKKKKTILTMLDDVVNLDEDKILRRYVELITVTLRTNYYQVDADGNYKEYISFKLDSHNLSDIPLPKPLYEIFVYSYRFEGIHLRAGKVARGGLRWSDRREDFRTEILGLMKAQQVKNSVIVPSGAKGGFVPKRIHPQMTREEFMAEGIACYKLFVRGLLDLTDNHLDGRIVSPADVVRYDDDDPYLVVAADKGTATFSDIANEISEEYDFWLGDAFASGGSTGYDHKKMGITARGAWESVKRHFREIGWDIQTKSFTVVGIGDMAGDVFGNGMLLSQQIKLVGAFNHLHIFIDPDPDPASSFKERERLFSLPRCSWKDYDKKLISKGGGIFERSAKSIRLTPEIKARFNLNVNTIEPNDMIRAMLKAKVDLLWNGGIGTFVKSSKESHDDAGDRTNDFIRIDAEELSCRVIGEGGNLGFTQLARIDFALSGGLVNTDFIDNSAGVDCSDNEVNIKILLDSIVANGDLTEKQRNQLLVDMTNDVSALVLHDNYQQTQAISLANMMAFKAVALHTRFVNYLISHGKLDPVIEFIPDEKTLLERKSVEKGYVGPEIAVLLCYSKIIIDQQILASELPEDRYMSTVLEAAFPAILSKKYSSVIPAHKLKREIIATKLSNIVVNEMGFTFVYRIHSETGALTADIVRAYMAARDIFSIPERWKEIQSLDNIVSTDAQLDMMLQYVRLLRRATRWFLRSDHMHQDINTLVGLYKPGVDTLRDSLHEIVSESQLERSKGIIESYLEENIPEHVAVELTRCRGYFSILDIVEVASELKCDLEHVASLYYKLGEFFNLNWLRRQIIVNTTENYWESLSREALRDDIDWQQRQLVSGILLAVSRSRDDIDQVIEDWAQQYQLIIGRWNDILSELKATRSLTYVMFFVASNELSHLTQTVAQQAGVGCNKKDTNIDKH